ncbi:MAG: TonB-dependent receptor [Phycisphaerae bacterium]|nr:TonB-dependent receptor [Phycisphaerae bacterium]
MKPRRLDIKVIRQTVLIGAALIGVFAVAPAYGDARAALATTKPASEPVDAADLNDITPAVGSAPGIGDDGSELMLFKDIPVVVAADMRKQTLQQAPASVNVVSANDIELFNYRSLADVLRGQRSFYIYNDGLNSFAGVRGFQRPGDPNARILVLEDGRPTNELVYGQSHFDQDFVVPMEAVKQVEIVRGPGSSLYGTNAMFGVINVVTKDGADVNGIAVKTEAGTAETIHENVLYGEQFKGGWDVIADISGFSTAGDQDIIYDGVTDAAHNFGHIRHSDDQDTVTGFAKIKNGPITFQVDSASRQTDDSTATYLTSFFNPGWLKEHQTNATLRLDKAFDGQDLHAMLYYTHYDFRLKSIYDTTQVTTPYDYYTNAEDDFIGEQVHYGWQVTPDFHLLAGADATEALHTRQYDTDTIDGQILNVPASYSSFGLFVEGEQKVTSWLTVTVGGRFDEVQRVGTNLSPRVAVVVTPTKQDTIKALYGSAFRSPTLADLLYATPPPSGVIANPDLHPEKIATYELAWEHQYKNGWQTTLNGYLWNLTNPVDTAVLPDGSTQQQNGGALWAHGVEAEIDKRWESGASFRAYATYSRATDDNGILSHSPEWITGTSFAVPVLWKNTFLAVEPQIVGSMKNDLGEYVSPTFVTNVIFTSRDVCKGLTFQAGVYNLFANYARLPREGAFNQVQSTLNYPNPEAMVSLTYKF